MAYFQSEYFRKAVCPVLDSDMQTLLQKWPNVCNKRCPKNQNKKSIFAQILLLTRSKCLSEDFKKIRKNNSGKEEF